MAASTRQPRPVGDRARGHVVGRGHRLAHPGQEGQVVGPDLHAHQERGDRHGREQRRTADGEGRPAPGHEHPAEEEGGLELHQRAGRRREAERDRPVERAPADGEAQVEDRAHLAQLEPVEVREAQRRQGDHGPAHRAVNREQRRPHEEARRQRADPGPGPERIREEGEGNHDQGERRRVEVDGEAPRDVHGGVVEGLAGQQAIGRLRVRLEVVAEGGSRGPEDRQGGGGEQDEDERRGEPRPPQPRGRPNAPTDCYRASPSRHCGRSEAGHGVAR